VGREAALALVDAKLAEATQGTSTLIRRDEACDLLLDLRNELDDFYVLRELEASFMRRARRGSR
jgi:hypothetical protein